MYTTNFFNFNIQLNSVGSLFHTWSGSGWGPGLSPPPISHLSYYRCQYRVSLFGLILIGVYTSDPESFSIYAFLNCSESLMLLNVFSPDDWFVPRRVCLKVSLFTEPSIFLFLFIDLLYRLLSFTSFWSNPRCYSAAGLQTPPIFFRKL